MSHECMIAGSTGVFGKCFVAAAGPLYIGYGQDSGGNSGGGIPTGVLPAAGAGVCGVAAEDKNVALGVMVYTDGFLPVTTGAALIAGTLVQTDAFGQAVPWDGTVGHRPVGYCMGDTASGHDAPILLK